MSFLFLALLSYLLSSVTAQTTTTQFCYTATSAASSFYGPWSVTIFGSVTASNGVLTSGTATRTQYAEDGSVAVASLVLATAVGSSGADNLLGVGAPYADASGWLFTVASSTDSANNTYVPNAAAQYVTFPNGHSTYAVSTNTKQYATTHLPQTSLSCLYPAIAAPRSIRSPSTPYSVFVRCPLC